MRDELLTAIADNQLFLQYQPQMTSDGRSMASVEALVRWHHPEKGSIGPGDFTPDAEAAGVMSELGNWILRRACRDCARWPRISVAVNVSALQLRDTNFVETVVDIVREEGLAFERLELEIVESAVIEDFARASEALSRLRSLGIRIALDDFGTGFSSLTYLRRLPLDKIKIDKSFIDDLDKVQSAAIVHAVIALSRALGLKVTAEGVETEAQQRFLRSAGCHFLQGYLFSRPVEAAEIARRLAEPPPLA
ncbi:putative bifunctional diguanylate cyclase/phosphodiesterase [Methylobrevis albus]|uniref:EAL domain-containing protein n=1 Tax=Methylobrevis albus TaxID=2793297 RepID=A0A931I4T0_9HYPH|nr:EAL domain-containing protein [Methylobrevis albus]MBH0239210.1 EAL domain-containing protein [Methylobrevis albus]